MTTRCFLRCPVWEQTNHHFPNHKWSRDRLKAWVEAIGRTCETEADYEYFKTKKLCHIHFSPIYCYSYRRLSPLAIPTLYLTKESRDEYWSKDLELRKSMLLQSKSHMDKISKAVAVINNEKSVTYVPQEKLLSNNTQTLIGSDVQESLVNYVCILDKLEVNNKSKNDDVQEQPIIDLFAPSSAEENVSENVEEFILENVSENVEEFILEYVPTIKKIKTDDAQDQPMTDLSVYNSIEANVPNNLKEFIVKCEPIKDLSALSAGKENVPSPVAEIIIEYVPTTEVTEQELLMKYTPTYNTTSEVVENFPHESFIDSIPDDCTLLKKCTEDDEKNFDIVQTCPKQKKKPKRKYSALSWESSLRILMEHNYSKISVVASTSHISSNGMHPKKIIRTLKRQVMTLRKQLKFYKKRCKDMLCINQQALSNKMERKMITKISHKGQESHRKAYKNVISHLKRKNV